MKRFVRLFAVALLLAIVVSFVFKKLTVDDSGGKTPTTPATTVAPGLESPKVSVVVAEVNLEPYERVIEKTMVRKRKFPEALLPRYARFDIKDVVGKLPTEPIYRGEIISLARLVNEADYKESLRRLIPPGYRALAVTVGGLSSVSGFVSQGDVVDLAATFPVPLKTSGKRGSTSMSRIILQNIKVLIVGNKYNPVYKENPAGFIEGDLGNKPITFAVAPEDAAIIHHIALQGKSSFRIVLKNTEDKETVATDGFSLYQLEEETRRIVDNAEADSDAPKEGEKPTETRHYAIEVYEGGKKVRDEHFQETIVFE